MMTTQMRQAIEKAVRDRKVAGKEIPTIGFPVGAIGVAKGGYVKDLLAQSEVQVRTRAVLEGYLVDAVAGCVEDRRLVEQVGLEVVREVDALMSETDGLDYDGIVSVQRLWTSEERAIMTLRNMDACIAARRLGLI